METYSSRSEPKINMNRYNRPLTSWSADSTRNRKAALKIETYACVYHGGQSPTPKPLPKKLEYDFKCLNHNVAARPSMLLQQVLEPVGRRFGSRRCGPSFEVPNPTGTSLRGAQPRYGGAQNLMTTMTRTMTLAVTTTTTRTTTTTTTTSRDQNNQNRKPPE